jgi:hypothetical protein
LSFDEDAYIDAESEDEEDSNSIPEKHKYKMYLKEKTLNLIKSKNVEFFNQIKKTSKCDINIEGDTDIEILCAD